MKDKGTIQSFPTSDSPVNEAFEGIVELYYQINGYITSTGKWFWKYEENKRQRGYQDVDLLAINGEKTIIVSVSSNFDDKISFKRGGVFNVEKYQLLKNYFDRVVDYFRDTPDYKWMIEDNREIIKTIAVVSQPSSKHMGRISPILELDGIVVIDMNQMIDEIVEYLNDHPHTKIQNQTLRLLQILNYKKLIK